MNYKVYVISTLLYGVMALLGLFCFIYFLFRQEWFLVIISGLIVYVSVDNFFCGERVCNAGLIVKSHHVIPPFLKKR